MTGDLLFALEHYGHEAFRAWCSKAWSGCCEGIELKRSLLVDGASDRLLLAAEEATWIRRVKFCPMPSFARDRLKRATSIQKACGEPSDWSWEPIRDGDYYAEFVAFVQLQPLVFWQLFQLQRGYIELADGAGRRAYEYGAQASHARWERDRAEKRLATAKKRANAIRKSRLGLTREINLLTQACAAARHLLRDGPVSSQLDWVVKRTVSWAPFKLLDQPAWTEAEAKEEGYR